MKKLFIIMLTFALLLVWTPAFAGNRDKKKQRNQYRTQQNQQRHHRVYKKKHRRPLYKKFNYRGHRTWNRWQFEMLNPRYDNGRYYLTREGLLMFSYCNGGSCFAVSISN